MRKIFFIGLLALGVSLSSFASEYIPGSEKEVEKYLNNIENFSAEFAQLDANGIASKGKFYLEKPGKFRWEYDDQPLLIVSNGTLLTYFDKQLNEITYVPASETLAGFLARDEIKLSGDVKLLEYSEKGRFVKTIITQTEKPEEGNLALYFEKDPMKLAMMEVIDSNGDSTKVFFDKQDFASKIDREKFIFKDPNFIKDAWE